MVKFTLGESAPPGLATVMVADPGVSMREAGTVAVSWVGLVYTVERGVPFQRTVAPLRKADPVTISWRDAPPAVADVGLRLVMVGEAGEFTAKDKALEVAPPGFATVMVADPGVSSREAGTVAVS
jgi:hypothetical protein